MDMDMDIAHQCISFNVKDRPSINRVLKRIEEAFQLHNQRTASKGAATVATIPSHQNQNQNLKDFLIPLDDIKKAIGDFSPKTLAGDGGFGFVHKGQLPKRWQNRTAAIKRLDRNGQQGEKEFQNELELIFRFHHKNIIPFIGYCVEGGEMILVTEYAINGSLDRHLGNPKKSCRLTWTQRLKICLGAAKGLNYLHSGLGEENKVIHRDVKSANILLDENLEAKVCDFGLSKSDITNVPHSGVYTKAAGTNFYMDPIYHESGKLRTESDVYSFGVVMFEMLSGMMAYHRKYFEDGKPQYLINLVRRYYPDTQNILMDPDLKDQIDSRSFLTFKETAYECINMTYKERPTMETVIDRIEEALEYQVKKESAAKVTEN